jgi:twinkle protein
MSDQTDIKDRVRAAVNLPEWIMRDGVPLTGSGNEWKGKCPFHDDRTPSFTVFNKPDSGWRYHCFGCDADGDIFEYIMRRKGLDFPQALRQAANSVGIANPVPTAGKASADSTKPDFRGFDPQQYRPLVADGKVWKYLTEQRKLDGGLLVEYSVGETIDGEAYSFAYKWQPPGWPKDRDPKFEFVKVVKVDREDGKKIEWRDPRGGKNILFGMSAERVRAAHDAGGELVICEGELDAISWAQFGFAAVSVPGGAKYTGWIDHCWDWLQKFSKIHISFDEDAAGRMKVAEIVTRLGMARTDIVRLPNRDEGQKFKDANECLQAGVLAAEMADCLKHAEFLKPEKLKSIYDFEMEIWSKLHNVSADYVGLPLPWGNFNGSSLQFKLRYGEVTVWTGYNKHGKSEVLNHCMIDLCLRHGERALICSLEVSAAETYRKLLRMAHAKAQVELKEIPRESFVEVLLAPLGDRVWVYDHVGYAKVDDVLNVLLYAYQRFGCRQFVLDSLMKFDELDGEGQEQWNRQRDFMSKLTTFAATYNVHIHLVAHSRKPGDRMGEAKIPRRYDINGSGYISNLPHNVIVVWRNRAKQDALEEIFQAADDAWAKAYPDAATPPWKRLLGGPPAPSAPAEFRKSWDQMVFIIENSISKAMSEKFLKLVKQHDSYVIVDAQRGGDGDCPARQLWFHYDSLQFLEKSPWASDGPAELKRPTCYVELRAKSSEE